MCYWNTYGHLEVCPILVALLMVDQPQAAPSPRLPVPAPQALATTHPVIHNNRYGWLYKIITQYSDLINILESHWLGKGIGYFIGNFSLLLYIIHDVMYVVYVTATSSTKHWNTYKFTVILWFPQSIYIYIYIYLYGLLTYRFCWACFSALAARLIPIPIFFVWRI